MNGFNKVILAGTLTRDPELRYTTSGLPVATFGMATNRQWPGKDGTLQEETEWHTIVAWDKLAQICSEHLSKGRLIYIEGRIHTRSWESNGQKQYKTEIVATDMLILDPRQQAEDQQPVTAQRQAAEPAPPRGGNGSATRTRSAAAVAEADIDPDELPF